MNRVMLFSLIILLAVGILGCSDTAEAEGPYLVNDLTLDTSRTFVLVQNHQASTFKKTVYVLALEDDIEVTAWRFVDSVWTLVLPNMTYATTDSIMICPEGFTMPVEGQFDALTLKGTVLGGGVQVHAYK